MTALWLDGRLQDAAHARLDPGDRGFLLGDGAFETMRLAGGAVRRWPAHRRRIARALDTLAIAPPDWVEIEAGFAALADANDLDEAVIRLTVSRGALGRGFEAPDGEAGTVLITAAARSDPPDAVNLAQIDAPRRDPASLATRFKPIGYGDNLHARRLARAAGADMALMLSSAGAVSCADCANIIWLSGRSFVAPGPEAGALAGTTRDALIEIAKDRGLRRTEAADLPLKHAEAALVCNAVMGGVAVSAIDGKRLDTEQPGLAELTRAEAEAG